MEFTITAPTAEQLTAVAVSAIVAKAALLVREHGWDKWRAYELGKDCIRDFTRENAEEYEQAIKLLTEALNI
jgi:hypothetical protein